MYDFNNDPSKKKITIAEFLDAMEKNGYEKIQGEFIIYEEVYDSDGEPDFDRIKGACALGQAALNLKVDPHSLYDRLTIDLNDDENYIAWGELIASMNDMTEAPIPEIAKHFREQMKEILNHEIYVAISNWKE